MEFFLISSLGTSTIFEKQKLKYVRNPKSHTPGHMGINEI